MINYFIYMYSYVFLHISDKSLSAKFQIFKERTRNICLSIYLSNWHGWNSTLIQKWNKRIYEKYFFKNLPPRKLLKLDVLLLLLSGGLGFAIGYLQNSWPRRAKEESCCLFLASRIALGSVNWTGNSSLFQTKRNR